MRSALLVDRSPRPDLSAFVHGPTDAIAWRGDGGTSGCGCGRGECKGDSCPCGCGSAPYGHLDVVASGWDAAGKACGDCSGTQRRGEWPPDGGPGFWGSLFGPGMFGDLWGGGGVFLPAPGGPPRFPRPPDDCDPSTPWIDVFCPPKAPAPGLCPRPDTGEECTAPNSDDWDLDPIWYPDYGSGKHEVRVPVGTDLSTTSLFLVLHGAGGHVSEVEHIADAISAICFPSISLRWDSGPTAQNRCAAELGVFVDDDTWNDCIEEKKEDQLMNRVMGIQPQLRTLIEKLATADPAWGGFLVQDGNEVRPNWARIVIAGYSEGANEGAYVFRQRSAAGLMMISGGGTSGTRLETIPFTFARWMYPDLADNTRVVGLYHVDEAYGDQMADADGWQLHGLIQGTPGHAEAPGPFYDAFGGASHLYSDQYAPGDAPPWGALDEAIHEAGHAATNDLRLRAAHMYLACRAAGRATSLLPVP